MNAFRQDLLAPSGVEYAISLKFTPFARGRYPIPGGGEVIANLVVARQNVLRVFDVRVEAAPLPTQAQVLAGDHGRSRRGMDTVEGEVQMDVGGEGFVSVAAVKSTGQHARQARTVTRFYLVRQHRVHGTVTGLAKVRTTATAEDGLDRLLVSFKDAKIALLEWSEVTHNLSTVSIHTYERAPQMLTFDPTRALHELRVDPNSRCAVLTLPQDALAVLPFFESQTDLDIDMDQGNITREVPYSPSFVMSLPEIDKNIRNIIDIVFLPGLNNPTLAVLFQTQQTWTSRLAEFKDTVGLRLITLDLVSRSYPVIASVDNLPYDSLKLMACPSAVGGVVVISSNSVIHVDQSGKPVGVAFNGWARRVSDFPFAPPTRDEVLEGSQCAFISDRVFLIVYRDGSIVPVELVADGRNIGKIEIGDKLAQTTMPSLAHLVRDDLFFVGSLVGPSVLLQLQQVEVQDSTGSGLNKPISLEDDPMDSDDDDLYGASGPTVAGSSSTLTVASEKQRVLRLSIADFMIGHGPIHDLTFLLGRNGDRLVSQLLTGVGAGQTGGLLALQREMPTIVRRKLHKVGGNFGVWSFPLRRSMKVAGMNIERNSDLDTVIFSCDATPSPGLSRVAIKDERDDAEVIARSPNVTIGVGPFFQRTAILQVTTNSIRVLKPDGSERQNIKDVDGTTPRAKIKACSVADPYVLVIREDNSLGLFIGETGKGKMRRKDMSALGDKTSRYLAASFYQDQSGLFRVGTKQTGSQTAASTTIESAMDEGRGSQWLLLCRPQGVIEIWTLPKLALVFSCNAISTIPHILTDTLHPAAPSPAQDPPRPPEDEDVDEIIIAPLGESSPVPHLLVLFRSGQLVMYAATPVASALPDQGRDTTLQVAFVRVHNSFIDMGPGEQIERRGPQAYRHLIPFSTPVSGVFLTGTRPKWIYATKQCSVRLTPAANSVVHSFTSCSVWGKRTQFLMHTDEGPCLVEWMPGLSLQEELPSFFIPRGRPYTSVAFEPATGLIIAGSSMRSRFVLFDEDGNTVWQPEGEFISDPSTETSTLELIDPSAWRTVAAFEFPFNEFINVVKTVNLETASAEAGSKDFICVGTTVFRGEDLAVKGATYIFEVVEIVPDGDRRQFKLRLMCRDEAKGPVTALCGINGYLVNSMGQKVFVRAFEQDERLVGVAFMDVGLYVTSLRSMKNLLLIADAVKSVWFCAFQEDPFKLLPISKDFQRSSLLTAEFFFAHDDMAIATTDEAGIVRLFRYDPFHADSTDGQRLICQTEFFAQSEMRSVVTTIRHNKDENDATPPQSKLIYAGSDGSLSALIPLGDEEFKRLHLLQGQLTRNVQHVAGLNPRAFRAVRNEYVARPLTKGIVDGNLLSVFHDLATPQQVEFTKQIGTNPETVSKDLLAVQTAW